MPHCLRTKKFNYGGKKNRRVGRENEISRSREEEKEEERKRRAKLRDKDELAVEGIQGKSNVIVGNRTRLRGLDVG